MPRNQVFKAEPSNFMAESKLSNNGDLELDPTDLKFILMLEFHAKIQDLLNQTKHKLLTRNCLSIFLVYFQ